QINQELDTQRKREKRSLEELIQKAQLSSKKAEYEKALSGLKNSKYVLLKNESDLNEEQINKLSEVKNVSPVLKEMHE
ncbi:MAG: transposase, partial [Nostoc sp.]